MSLSNRNIRTANHVLIVEDDPVNMKILSKYLHDSGYIFEKANDGVEAWEIIQKSPIHFDVIILDRIMPNMNGLEFTKKIKSDDKFHGIPIIMQTSARSMNEVTEGIKAGINYYLAKPYTKERLITLVKAAIRDRKTSAEFEARLLQQKNAFGTIEKGEFSIQTPEQAGDIAFMLGSLFPRPDLAVTGIYELLLNSIEHGNLKIGLEEKAKLLKNSLLESEIQRRLELEENKTKRVTIKLSHSASEINIHIGDEGEGFDWKSYMDAELPANVGKGIAKAKLLSFDKIEYSELGNEVDIISFFK